ncbi:MAG: glycosyltransferase [Ilumatobacteraceae bacterium]|jgi:glycosyltransferase involved in cell wall biosynthesis|nr:glycosyltransferase [Ilumatobacteraceae bacterium]
MTTIGLYTDSEVLGGAERSLLNLVAAYHGTAKLVVLSTNRHFLREIDHMEGIDSTFLHARSSFLGAVIDHRRQFRELGLDLVQVTLANPFTSRAALLGGVLARIPTVAVEQLVLPSRRRRGSVFKRLLAGAQAGTIAVGSASADDLTRYFGIPRHSITVVHNGVAESEFVRPPTSSPPVVGCAARLEDQKGIDLLLRAMAQIPDARLVLVGDGDRRIALEQQAAELGITDRVDFVGWLPDARQQIASFDVFALASRDEAFPLTIVEAMLSGTPVVATDVGSVAEAVIDSVTGLLVPAGDVPALVVALRRMLDDAQLRDRLALAARSHAVEHFTDVAMAEGYDRVWRSILR